MISVIMIVIVIVTMVMIVAVTVTMVMIVAVFMTMIMTMVVTVTVKVITDANAIMIMSVAWEMTGTVITIVIATAMITEEMSEYSLHFREKPVVVTNSYNYELNSVCKVSLCAALFHGQKKTGHKQENTLTYMSILCNIGDGQQENWRIANITK